jgi:hypothetical protein
LTPSHCTCAETHPSYAHITISLDEIRRVQGGMTIDKLIKKPGGKIWKQAPSPGWAPVSQMCSLPRAQSRFHRCVSVVCYNLEVVW